MKNTPTIGFIGAGNMAHALIAGLLNSGKVQPNCLKVSDTNTALLNTRREAFGIETFTDNAALVACCDVVILAIKPQVVRQVCQTLTNALTANTLMISIVAGAAAQDIARWLNQPKLAIIRAMPNTPALIGQGATGLFANARANSLHKSLAADILGSVGQCVWVKDETLLHAITALSGSGPAYFFLLLESMINTGIGMGLTPDTARMLSVQTALGASLMAQQSNDSLSQLRTNVTSPNGTTQAAIESFQAQDFEAITARAIRKAFDKSRLITAHLKQS